MPSIEANKCDWLPTGEEALASMLAAIDAAKNSIRLEMYIVTDCPVALRFLAALISARQRGVQVRILMDAGGSFALAASFWDSLRAAGGEVRAFNPLTLKRFNIRNHRKLVVCDDRVAFIGGFNISTEYDGDGVTRGWCDLGMRIEGPLAAPLAATFDGMFQNAELQHKRFPRLRRLNSKRVVASTEAQILLSGPGRGRSPIKHALQEDLAHAKNVQIVMAYFLPTWRMRRDLTRVARRGGAVQFILAGKSDVRVSQLAGQSLYRKFLKAGVGIFEYQPQILHAKLIIVDDVVYVGSANLDQRGLNINYELLVRFESKVMVAQAREIFANALKHSKPVELAEWRKSRTLWMKLKQRFAYWLLVRFDTYVARRQWKNLPD
jgi:cardiolipin synthase